MENVAFPLLSLHGDDQAKENRAFRLAFDVTIRSVLQVIALVLKSCVVKLNSLRVDALAACSFLHFHLQPIPLLKRVSQVNDHMF